MQDLPLADLDAIAARVVAAVAQQEPASADAALFLLRHYIASPRDELREPLGIVLAQGLAAAGAGPGPLERAAWLTLFVEAAAIADDARIVEAAGVLVRSLRDDWPIDSASTAGVISAAASVDACLRASSLFDPMELVPPAIDELERAIGGAYRPGEGLRPAPAVPPSRPELATHVHAASALLTAWTVTGRLPYSMLAEELMQPCRNIPEGDDPDVHCLATRVFCRLAALHDDPDYRAAAVLAPAADYASDAVRMLRGRRDRALADQLPHTALYGIALRELMSLR